MITAPQRSQHQTAPIEPAYPPEPVAVRSMPQEPVRSVPLTARSNAPVVDTGQAARASLEKDKFSKLAMSAAAALPDVRAEARRCAEAIVFDLTGLHVDADKTYLNRFHGSQSASTASGWEHLDEEPASSISLTDAVLNNFSEHDWVPGNLDLEAGLYKDGPGQSQKSGYGAHNQIPLAPSDFMRGVWKYDLQAKVTEKITRFWKDHADDYRTVLKGEFIYQARQQLQTQLNSLPAERALQVPEHQFSRNDFRRLMEAIGGVPVDENQPLGVEQLKAPFPVSGSVDVHAFDINGFKSTDILRFTLPDTGPREYLKGRLNGRQILYIPGARPAFLTFASLEKMDQWVADQARSASTRKALESHFSLENRQDRGADTFWLNLLYAVNPLTELIALIPSRPKEGVDVSLEHLGTGASDNLEGTVIDRSNFAIKDDIFSHMAQLTAERMYSDADVAIKSDSEVTRDTWLNDLSVAAQLLARLAPLGAPAAAAAVFTGLAEAAVGGEKTVSGDTQAERAVGNAKVIDGMLNTLFSISGGAKVDDPFTLPQEGPPVIVPAFSEADIGLPDFSEHALPDALLEGCTIKGDGTYQVGEQHYVRYGEGGGERGVFEISRVYKSGGPVWVINPVTRARVMLLEPTGNGQWRMNRMLGGGREGQQLPSKRPRDATGTSASATSSDGQAGQSTFKRPRLAEAFPGEKAELEPPVKGKNVFYKYTSQDRQASFAAQRAFEPSSTHLNGTPLPRGQGRHYFTDLAPEDRPTEQISRLIFGRRRYGNTLDKMTNYFEVNTSGLVLLSDPDYPHIFYVDTKFDIPLQYRTGPGSGLTNRVISRGETPYMPPNPG